MDGVYYVDADVVLGGNGMKIMYDVETYIDGERDFLHFEDTIPFVLTYNFNFEYSLISSEEALEMYQNN